MVKIDIICRLSEVCRHCLELASKSQTSADIDTLVQSYEQDFLTILKDTYLKLLDEKLPQDLIEEFDKLYKSLEKYSIGAMFVMNKKKIEKDFTAFFKDFVALCELIKENKQGN